MATLAVVHEADPAPHRVHDIIAPPGDRSGHRTRRKSPKARAKWLTASVRNDAEKVIAAAFDQAEARDPQHRRCWVVLVDGAEHQLELIQTAAARRSVKIHTGTAAGTAWPTTSAGCWRSARAAPSTRRPGG